MKDWIDDNPVLFVIVLIIGAGAIMAVAGIKEAGLASLTGAFGVLTESLNSKKKASDKAQEAVLKEREKTDQMLGDVCDEIEKAKSLDGDTVAYALNDIISKLRNRSS